MKLIKTITKKDLKWDFFRGSGKGGQKRNKTENCARCTHLQSKSFSTSESSRSKQQNIKKALQKIVRTPSFLNWIDSLFETKHNFKIIVEEDIKIYDLGEFKEPKRKEKKRKPVLKSKSKIERQISKKIKNQYKKQF